jgi:hypothetical protein
MMDKINLPIPGKDGPATFDHSLLLFERGGVDSSGRPLFRLRAGATDDLNKWKRLAKGYQDAQMAGGRPFGLLF